MPVGTSICSALESVEISMSTVSVTACLGVRRDVDERNLRILQDVDECRLVDRQLLQSPGVLSSLSDPIYSGRRNTINEYQKTVPKKSTP